MEGFDPLPENIDEHCDLEDAQITWQTHTWSEVFRLGQRNTSDRSYTDVLNLLFELYTQPGKIRFGFLLLLILLVHNVLKEQNEPILSEVNDRWWLQH